MIVLGLDPGTRRFGWGVVAKRGSRLVHIAHGVVALGDGPLAPRLAVLETALDEVVRTHQPDQASAESIFFHRDPQAASKLGHARGVALMVCGRAEVEVFEYAPARVKRTVAAHGRADKAQVAQMIRVILSLAVAPPSDAADALALAVTHLQNSNVRAR